MKNIVLAIIYTLLLFSSCQTDKGKIKSIQNLNIIVDSFQIKINPNCLPLYYTSYVATIDGNEIFIGYNNQLHSFDLFNLDEGNFVKQILLEHRGPNGIPNIGKFVACEDRIMVKANPYYAVLDFNGVVLNKIKPIDLFLEQNIRNYTLGRGISMSNTNTLCYDCTNELLVIPVYPTLLQNDPGYYESSFMALIDLEKLSLKIIDLPYPEIFRTGKFYGNLDRPNFILKNDSIIFNYRNSSKIYIYVLKSGKTIIFNILSSNSKNESDPISYESLSDIKKIIRHEGTSLQFHPVKYDPHQNLYYRVHNARAEKGKMLMSAKSYLTIINDDFDKISEYVLPGSFFPVSNISSKGILFQKKESYISDFNTITYYIISLREEES